MSEQASDLSSSLDNVRLKRLISLGVILLTSMIIANGAFAVFFFVSAQEISETTNALKKSAFDARRRIDNQNNRLVDQEIRIRQAYQDIRVALDQQAGSADTHVIADALTLSKSFLFEDRRLNPSEIAILQAATNAHDALLDDVQAVFIQGVLHLIEYRLRGDFVRKGDQRLPTDLERALELFETVPLEHALKPPAIAGQAWVLFEDASSERTNYNSQACQKIFSVLEPLDHSRVQYPQPLYWKAQCQRKLGFTRDSFINYVRTLEATVAVTRENYPDAGRLELAMNAFHGTGTTLIALAPLQVHTESIREALHVGRELCPTSTGENTDIQELGLAIDCLQQAIDLRVALGQSENLQSGTRENISFAYLKSQDYERAFQNSLAVERTGLFAWNETVRAISASKRTIKDPIEQLKADEVRAEATNNLKMFSPWELNICELKELLGADLYPDAQRLLNFSKAYVDQECGSLHEYAWGELEEQTSRDQNLEHADGAD